MNSTVAIDPYSEVSPNVGGAPSLTLSSVPLAHPAFARINDYSDAQAIHTAVMSLFPHNLPGNLGQRRATNAILYRMETSTRNPHLLVQSLLPPAVDETGLLKTTNMAAWLSRNVTEGTPITVRLRYNPVHMREKKRVRLHGTKLAENLENRLSWLTGFTLESATKEPDMHLNGTPLYVTDIVATGIISNPVEAGNDIIHGVGKARSYGCGMLLISPR